MTEFVMKRTLGVREAAQLAGLSFQAMYNRIHSQSVPCMQIDGVWRIPVEEFGAWRSWQQQGRQGLPPREGELTVRDAATHYGVVETTLWGWMYRGHVASRREGRRRWILQASLEAFLQAEETLLDKEADDADRTKTAL